MLVRVAPFTGLGECTKAALPPVVLLVLLKLLAAGVACVSVRALV